MMAERDTTDRYPRRLSARAGGERVRGRVSGIARFGLFVKLDETGADGLVPISALGREYFLYDADRQTLTGEKSRRDRARGAGDGAAGRGGAGDRRPALRGPRALDGRSLPSGGRARRGRDAPAKAGQIPDPALGRPEARAIDPLRRIRVARVRLINFY